MVPGSFGLSLHERTSMEPCPWTSNTKEKGGCYRKDCLSCPLLLGPILGSFSHWHRVPDLVYLPPRAEPETRIWVQMVCLGVSLRKPREEGMEVRQEDVPQGGCYHSGHPGHNPPGSSKRLWRIVPLRGRNTGTFFC